MRRFWMAVKKHLNFILLLLALLLLGVLLIQMVGPLVALLIVELPGVAIAIAVLLCFLLLLRVACRLAARVRFLRRLDAACREQGVVLHKIGHPYLNTLFYIRGGAEIELRDRTICLYFAPCFRRGVPVCFQADGTVAYYHAIRIRRIELFSWQHVWRFTDEIEQGAVILLSPVPRRVYVQDGQHRLPADNGSTVAGASIYTCGAFLRDFDRMAHSDRLKRRFGE